MERELLLLGILRRQEMHGYQLVEFIEHNLGACTDLKKPTAYFLLEKMAQRGWVDYADTQAGRRPTRRVYRLTAAGETAFQALLRENLAGYQPVYFGGDAGLAFLDALPALEAAAALQERLNGLVAAREALQAAPLHQGSTRLLIDHQAQHLESEIRWLQEVISSLLQSESNEPPVKQTTS